MSRAITQQFLIDLTRDMEKNFGIPHMADIPYAEIVANAPLSNMYTDKPVKYGWGKTNMPLFVMDLLGVCVMGVYRTSTADWNIGYMGIDVYATLFEDIAIEKAKVV